MSKKADDPMNLKEVEHQMRLNQLRRELNDVAPGPFIEGSSPDCPPDVKERFLEQVLKYEREEPVTLMALLAERGHRFPGPDELDDVQLTQQLWVLVEALAGLRVFIEFTNHLSDRELYSRLWNDALHEEGVYFPHDPGYAVHYDMIGTGSEEDTRLYLRYYADEMWRNSWRREFPEDPLPPHEDPPFDRDDNLPKAD